MSGKIFPVILSGGSGSRLWPLSRESFPKQLLPLSGERTMLQETAIRVADADAFHPLMVIANSDHRFVIAEQLREIGAPTPTIVLEPVARNTAPAVAAAAILAAAADPDAVLLVMPADHAVPDPEQFTATVKNGLAAAAAGSLVLFGIRPDCAATGYGYILAGEGEANQPRPVASFTEKPDAATAEAYLSDGRYYWNSGIFLLPAKSFLSELERHEPKILEAVTGSVAKARRDMDFLRLAQDDFARCPSISVDYAVMERTHRAAVVPATFSWSDVGAWSALWELGAKCTSGNVELGDTISVGTEGCYIRSEGPLVAAVGVSDLIVVATQDAVLVANRHDDQAVKTVVERLKASRHNSATQTRRVYRPWGWYEAVDAGQRFQVKRLTVKPGAKLSLQKHFHRSEHWVVVSGTAEVHLEGAQRLLSENESIYIPLGAVHRLGNPGKVPLSLIEVQSGPYLDEDDIVRLEDLYARV